MTAIGVIVTRAQPGASETAARLKPLGYQPILSPMIELSRVVPPPAYNLDGVQAILFTSANGVRFFADDCQWRGPAFCVGPSTTESAEAAGFAPARSADGNSDDLVALVKNSVDPAAGRLLHIANTAAVGTVAGRLRDTGFDVTFVGLYAPRSLNALSPEAISAFKAGEVSAVLFHSAKGARAFAEDAEQLDLSRSNAVAVSERALQPVSRFNWRSQSFARMPNEDGLLEALSTAISPVRDG